MRKYEIIWEQLRKLQNPDQWVKVTYKSADMAQTIINAVQVEKSRAQRARKSVNLPSFGKLKIRRAPQEHALYFTLENSGDQL